jgi:phosphoribosylaminoimidazole-succinocarboxamide synthase
MPEAFQTPELAGRSMFVEKAKVIPFECVVRGYLCGSGWKDYQKTGEICGIKLPPGLKENQQFPTPIFTPATKAETGHDENVPFSKLVDALGLELSSELESKSVGLYMQAAEYAWNKGIIIADTKFEWGHAHSSDDLTLIDEILTPDSSRFWSLDKYRLGATMPSFDKQGVRNWLEKSGWDKNSDPPALPAHVVRQTKLKYHEAYKKLTGKDL